MHSIQPLLLLLGALSATDPYVRQPGVDAVHYAFALSLNDSTDRIEGMANVRIRFTQAGQSSFWLDLTSRRRRAARA
jgi:hypothetical protein